MGDGTSPLSYFDKRALITLNGAGVSLTGAGEARREMPLWGGLTSTLRLAVTKAENVWEEKFICDFWLSASLSLILTAVISIHCLQALSVSSTLLIFCVAVGILNTCTLYIQCLSYVCEAGEISPKYENHLLRAG